MAEGLGREPGGIRGLVELIDAHYEAVEADLLDRGWRLAEVGRAFSWRDLLVMVRRFQADPSCATSKAVHGEHWTTRDQLLAIIIDVLNDANWQRGGNKSAPRPRRLPRPWERVKARLFGSGPIPVGDFRAWWDSKRRR